MAERTLLEIATAIADEVGINRPGSVVGSSDQQIQTLLSLLNREGREVSTKAGLSGGWQQLRREHTITTVAGQESYSFPTDLRYFINTTGWDRTNKNPLAGPLSPQEWQFFKSSFAGSGPGLRVRYRFINNRIYFDPVPTVSDRTISIEYYSHSWCESSTGTAQKFWASDTDVPRLPDDFFILGGIWRFLKAKDFDYAEEKLIYEQLVSRELSYSTMAPVIHLATPSFDDLIDPGAMLSTSDSSSSAGGSSGSSGWGEWGNDWGSW